MDKEIIKYLDDFFSFNYNDNLGVMLIDTFFSDKKLFKKEVEILYKWWNIKKKDFWNTTNMLKSLEG